MDADIEAWCAERGLVAVHHPDSRRVANTGIGFPDWVIIGKRIIYREVKGSNDVLSVAQRRVARAIISAGGDWAVWRPGDFYPLGKVRQELDALMWGGPKNAGTTRGPKPHK